MNDREVAIETWRVLRNPPHTWSTDMIEEYATAMEKLQASLPPKQRKSKAFREWKQQREYDRLLVGFGID